jgi:DNA helicase-2/ATP-dependent DNA helicase PcrA
LRCWKFGVQDIFAGREGDWLLPDAAFSKKARQRYDGSENDERRLFYVAMTRAKDMLYLSSFRRIKTRRSPSPFLLEVNGKEPDSVRALPLPPPFENSNAVEQEKPTLSFSDVAAYEHCPFSCRLSSSLGFQPQLAPELGYGKAVHHILRRLADHVQQRKAIPTEAEVAELFKTEFYLPFANRGAAWLRWARREWSPPEMPKSPCAEA